MRQWAISVGINQYQFFQPLSFAKNDAQAIQQFLVDDVGIPAEQCLLLTETSPPQWGKSTYPDRQTIQSWLDLLTQGYIQPDDTLWFFFSGYGICQQGQDYLVPIEGDPTAVQATAIPLESIFRSLRQVSAAKLLVLLDVNRNESSFSYETVGNHTVHLANITGIPTLLSCQPDEFSRETSALGHGFFTAALLDSLRNRQCTTVSALGQYLSQHLPALSEHYWRPIQQPVTICPTEKLQQSLVLTGAKAAMQTVGDRSTTLQTATATGKDYPTTLQALANQGHSLLGVSANGNGNGHLASTTAVANPTQIGLYASDGGTMGMNAGGTPGENRSTHASPSYGSPGASNGSTNGYMPLAKGLNNGFTSASTQNGVGTYNPIDSATQNHENGVAQPTHAATVPQSNSDHPKDVNDESSDALFWQPVLRWGSFVVVGLILGVLLRNCAAFTPKTSSVAPQAVQSGTKQAGSEQTGSGQMPVSAASPNTKAPGAKIPDVKTIVPISVSTKPAVKTLSPQPIATTQQFGVSGANRLNLSTGTGATVKPQPVQTKAVTHTAQPSVPSHLAKARALAAMKSDQASPYWYAIQEARKVQPGQPDYAQAKQEIAQWSRQIMSIARQRGRQGGFDAAIIAARLISQDQPMYAESKTAIASWCPPLRRQRGANPVQRNQARAICRTLS
ncbi:caspase family protein [Stenomitos frigidus]|uniref:Peptidase C14 caspase domain-containing protein n=1 Tax=Stenomitos frigidus ULC18 TaxID=2107698 RepID=A0A2T1E4V8_9CYAN|nr:caspase family protein [Stenomitos frigidus]PSB27792.1 hypothetical protein C7B82_15515 [Stenomitos frigidus ULC18]